MSAAADTLMPGVMPAALRPAINPWIIAITVTLATFMELLDTSIANVSAPAIGPTLGRWITDTYSWRWVFFINIPIGLLSLLLSSALISDPPEYTRERRANKGKLRIDYIGILLVAVGFGCLEVVL